MRKLALIFALCGCAAAQSTNLLNIIPNATGSAVGVVNFWDVTQTYTIAVTAPVLSANAVLTLPAPTGAVGCVEDSTGAGVLVVGACLPTPPVLLSGSSASSILTLTQSGTGNPLGLVSGGATLFLSGTAIVPGVSGGASLGDSSHYINDLYVENILLSASGGSLQWGPSFAANLNSTGGATFASGVTFNGSLSGAHAQNIGTGDGPNFAGIFTTSGSSSVIYVGSSGNFYNRTFAGTPSCVGVTDGWIGYDTSGDHLWVCSGGVAKSH